MDIEKLAKINIINAYSLEENGTYIATIDTTAEIAKQLYEGLNEVCKEKNIKFIVVNTSNDLDFRIMDIETAIDKVPIEELELSVRTYNLLKNKMRVNTIGEVMRLNRDSILIPEKSWEEINETIHKHKQKVKELYHD